MKILKIIAPQIFTDKISGAVLRLIQDYTEALPRNAYRVTPIPPPTETKSQEKAIRVTRGDVRNVVIARPMSCMIG